MHSRSENLLRKILDRETFPAQPSAQVCRIRLWYDVLTPSRVIKDVQLPDVHFARFTPSGLYFVAFGPLQHELILYRYTGLQFACAPVHGRGSNCSTHHSTGDGRSSSQGGEPSVTAEAEQSAEANVFQGTTQRQHHPEADTELSVLQTTPDADEGSESAPGPSNGQSTESAEEMPKKAAKFEGHFQLLWRKQLVQHPHMLCKDAFLCMHNETILVVAAQTTPHSHRQSGPGPTSVPLCEATTVFLVRTADGKVTDSLTVDCDFVPLGHNSAFTSCDDRLAILCLRSQTIKVLQVLADGRFVTLADLGSDLAMDDGLVIGLAAAAEQRWRAAHPHEAKQIDGREAALDQAVSQPSSHQGMSPAAHTGAASSMLRSVSGLLGGNTRGGRWAPSSATAGMIRSSSLTARGAPSLGQLLHAPNALVEHASGSQPQRQPQQLLRAPVTPSFNSGGNMITGLRHRLLAYIWRALQEPATAAVLLDCNDVGEGEGAPETPGLTEQHAHVTPGDTGILPPSAVKVNNSQRNYFLAHFESLATLVVWKMQLLDKDHLLLAVGPPEGGAAARTLDLQHKATFIAIYSISGSKVVTMFPYTSTEALEQWLLHAQWFHPGAASAPWHRFLTPNGHPASARAAIQRQLTQHFHSPSQVTRRALSAVPPSSGLLTSSPYLDAHLYRYDDKLINPIIRPRMVSEQTFKFMWRGPRESIRFKISHCWDLHDTGPRAPKQQVTWHFHPVVPFVFGVLQTQGQPTQAAIYHRPF